MQLRKRFAMPPPPENPHRRVAELMPRFRELRIDIEGISAKAPTDPLGVSVVFFNRVAEVRAQHFLLRLRDSLRRANYGQVFRMVEALDALDTAINTRNLLRRGVIVSRQGVNLTECEVLIGGEPYPYPIRSVAEWRKKAKSNNPEFQWALSASMELVEAGSESIIAAVEQLAVALKS